MAVKHDSIIPYLEIGNIQFNAFIVPNSNAIDLTITKDVSNRNPFMNTFEMYNVRWNLKELIKTLNANSRGLEKFFGLELVLTKVEKDMLNKKKSEIINYLQNLEKHYGQPNA